MKDYLEKRVYIPNQILIWKKGVKVLNIQFSVVPELLVILGLLENGSEIQWFHL